MEISRQAAKRVLKKAGAKRVSDGAASEFAETVEKFAYTVASKAVKLAKHAKRATIKREDVELAC